jgi:acetaldehyde dehydrogenase/alcohol dehydrogenase
VLFASAGMAFANAFLGVCHSMAHKLGGTHHVPHGLANALLISHVIRYNATGEPPIELAARIDGLTRVQ